MLFSGPTNYISLATAAFFGIGMYIVAGGHRSICRYPVLVSARRASPARARRGRRPRDAAHFRRLFRHLLARTCRTGAPDRDLAAACARHHERPLRARSTAPSRCITGSCSALAAVVYLVGWWIGRSRLGFALRIIGNDEVVAVHCGINTARAKVVLFVISSTFAAITGALVAPRWSYVEPIGRVQPVPVVSGRDHGAARRRASPVGTAASASSRSRCCGN